MSDDKISLFRSRVRHHKNPNAGEFVPPARETIVVVTYESPTKQSTKKIDANSRVILADKKRKKRQKKETDVQTFFFNG